LFCSNVKRYELYGIAKANVLLVVYVYKMLWYPVMCYSFELK